MPLLRDISYTIFVSYILVISLTSFCVVHYLIVHSRPYTKSHVIGYLYPQSRVITNNIMRKNLSSSKHCSQTTKL
jgi:hypothetical protein